MSKPTAAPVPADLMRAAESAVQEAFKDDHREPSAVWTVVIYRALVAVLPLHEQQVRAAVAVELEKQAHAAAVRDVNGPFCVEAATWTRAARTVRGGLDA